MGYDCCCGPCKTHVEKGAYIIGIFGFVFNLTVGIMNVVRVSGSSAAHNPDSITIPVCYLIAAFIYLFVIYAQKQDRNPYYYWPYLIIAGIGLVLTFFYMVVLVLFIIYATDQRITITEYDIKYTSATHLREMYAAMLVVLMISEVINAYLYSVIYRAYKYMKEEREKPRPVPAYPHPQPYPNA